MFLDSAAARKQVVYTGIWAVGDRRLMKMCCRKSSVRQMSHLLTYLFILLLVNGLFFSYPCIWLAQHHTIVVPLSAGLTFHIQILLTIVVAYVNLRRSWRGCCFDTMTRLRAIDWPIIGAWPSAAENPTCMKKSHLYIIFFSNLCVHSAILHVFSIMYILGNWMEDVGAEMICTIVVLVTSFIGCISTPLYAACCFTMSVETEVVEAISNPEARNLPSVSSPQNQTSLPEVIYETSC
ncbi:uncharacterized protein LOC142108518 [Mixophyes fleayi]|uniref:uncharacterized protein LOC142108518 n=1 Tax=Mixophyes fleayi TaxID=3061075 RepID=UPI003F4E3517